MITKSSRCSSFHQKISIVPEFQLLNIHVPTYVLQSTGGRFMLDASKEKIGKLYSIKKYKEKDMLVVKIFAYARISSKGGARLETLHTSSIIA